MKERLFLLELFLIGLVLLALGVVLLLQLYSSFDRRKGRGRHLKPSGEISCHYPASIFVAFWAFFLGILLLVCFLSPRLRPVLLSVAYYGFASLFLCLGFYSGVLLPSRCTQQVSGRYLGVQAAPTPYGFVVPNFSIRWNGTDYFIHTMGVSTVSRLNRLYSPNALYVIFINPHNPYEAIKSRRFSGSAALLLLIGIAFFFGGYFFS